jgi:hypothetical protein
VRGAANIKTMAEETKTVVMPIEKFGEGLTTARPWNIAALEGVERLNGRVAMLGFLAAVSGEAISGEGILGQLRRILGWLLG